MGRHQKLTAESTRAGKSMRQIVEDALDLHFEELIVQQRRAEAARRLLAHRPAPGEVAETWEEMLAIREADMIRRLEG